MTEIEEMYENAGIEKEFEKPSECSKNPYITCDGCILYDNKKGKCNNRKDYPPFTAKKQIGLIKWLAMRFDSDYMSYWHNEIKDVWIFRLHDFAELSSAIPCVYEGINKDFTESLCNLINDLWQDLTDQEKEEIRRILNENS